MNVAISRHKILDAAGMYNRRSRRKCEIAGEDENER
jgi:hypothetical protein